MDANKGANRNQLSVIVSIHAPVMDAKTSISAMSFTACFNPRARDGREAAV